MERECNLLIFHKSNMRNKCLFICLNLKPCKDFWHCSDTYVQELPMSQYPLQWAWGATTEQDFHAIYERRLCSPVASFTSWSTPRAFDQPLKITCKYCATQLVNTEQREQNENFPFLSKQVSSKQQWRGCRLLSTPELSWNSQCCSLLLYKIAAAGFKRLKLFRTRLRAWEFW